ncbi:VOC family protein [Chitinimonas sp. BJB300]|uniref:VOC family protein n=1 Tax=Chitinimonas sp. BJB300 TaxID=1559339 RepID=UPI000C0E058B|nr:VOC family protein [Chitinimonas sp. BJB300]PHV10713.1 glutathione transferase [Chitinimonas sp. BJB300]TSJ89771.1 glutathione transferase [Chitinimonas sp. BJB300]
MLTGLNHLTLAVHDVEKSFRFYVDLLGAEPHARWDAGAYLSIGDLWLCLSLDLTRQPDTAPDYTHYAFSTDNFSVTAARLRNAGVHEWKVNQSKGDSLYLQDPDGHRLEIHAGDLTARLAACRIAPYTGMVFFESNEETMCTTANA